MKSIPAAAFAIGLFVFGALAMPFITPLSFLTAEIYEAVGVGIKRDSAISQAAPTAVLLSWNTFGNAGTETTEPSVSNDPNLSPSTLTLGAGVTPAINANRFGGVNWWDTGDSSTTTLAQSVSGNDYIEFIVTPNPGFSFTPTSFVFIWDRSSTGPQNVALRSSADGYTTNLGTVSAILTGAFETNTINISGLTNLTSATTFRLYGYGGTAAGGTGGLDTPNSLTATATLNGSTAAVPVPAIQVTGGPLNFGNQTVNTTSGQLSLTVTNTGSADLVLGTPTFASGTQFAFTPDPNGTVIAPTDSALVSFTFTPTSIGSKNDTVNITSNVLGPAPAIVLSGTGVAGPTPTPSPSATDNVVFVTSTTHTGNLGGISGADNVCQLRAASAGLTGTYRAWLSSDTVNPAGRFTQSTSPYTLVNGTVIANNWTDLTDGSLLAAIDRTELGDAVASSSVWTGTQANGTAGAFGNCSNWTATGGVMSTSGSSSATTSAWTNAGTNTCTASARLYCFLQVPTANLAVDPTSVNFGNATIGGPGVNSSIVITNNGSPVEITALPVTGTNPADFSATSVALLPVTLNNGETLTVNLTFSPSGSGSREASLGINSNPTSLLSVPLIGTGVSPEIEVTPMAIDFGEQTEGLPTGLQSVTIRNTGTGGLALGTLVKSGTNDADFTIVDDPSGAVISSGESRQLRFRFTPAAQGNRTAQILIPNNDADESSAIVELSGFGVAPAAAAPTKGMWVFGGSIVPNPVSDPTGRATLINRSYANDVDTLYVSVYQSTTDPMSGRRMYADEDMAAVIGAAHANGQQVWAAYGDTGWHNFGCSSTDFPVQRMAEIAAYNASRPANERFDGVMLDVEPDPDPSTPGEFQALLSHYECMRNSLPASIKLGAAIRFFWDDDNVTYPEVGGVVKPAAHHIIDLDLDSVIVMGYRDTAGVSGGNGIIGLDENEVSYATAIGRPGLVLAGVETISGQPDNVTFFEEGQVAMNAEIALVASHFWSSSGFGGFAIHNYQGSYLSGLSGWPVGPTAAPASISGRVTTSRGAGISGVTITVQDLNGVSRTTVTSTFGHYRIAGLDAGEAYIVTASSRKYTFAAGSQLVNLDDNVDGVNFIATR